jgi:hypothetical protein
MVHRIDAINIDFRREQNGRRCPKLKINQISRRLLFHQISRKFEMVFISYEHGSNGTPAHITQRRRNVEENKKIIINSTRQGDNMTDDMSTMRTGDLRRNIEDVKFNNYRENRWQRSSRQTM